MINNHILNTCLASKKQSTNMKRNSLLTLVFVMIAMFCLPAKAAQNCYWGYCNSSVAGEFGSQKTAKGAIYIPQEVAQLYNGCTISNVNIGLAAMSNVTVFITKDLNGTPELTKTAGSLYRGFNDVKLGSTYTIDGEAFYIGYSYSGDNLSLGISSTYSENGCWADLGDGWKNYATDKNYEAPALAIQAKITGDNLPKDYWIYSSNNIVVEKNKACQLTFGVKNLSATVARSLKVACSVDGGEETTQDFTTIMGANIEKEFSFDYPGFDTNGNHIVKFRLVSVNGEQDDYAGNNEVEVGVRVVNSVPVQRLVCEEGTGTWCQYCPLGIVGLRKTSEKYPDNFIGIAVHKQDGLATTSYSEMTFSSYPRCYINRNLKNSMSPSASTLESEVKKILDQTPLVDVDIKAEFTDDSKTQIHAQTFTTFLSAHKNMAYRLSFVLLEDHIKGYQQSNTYAGTTTDMDGFENMSSYCSIDMDHVARMNYSYNGIRESIPSSVEADETTTYETTLDVPSTVQTRDNVSLVALVIDTQTGLIENAAKVKLGKQEETAILDTPVKLVPDFEFVGDALNLNGYTGKVSIYTANGVEVANHSLAPGLYIVKTFDGVTTQTRKMLKKN